jgi:RNase P subunit RPR2
MFKNIIAPVQAWLLSRGTCVGCGANLSDGKKVSSKTVSGKDQVTCKCGRIFIYDAKTNTYRRALLSEV